MGAEFEPDTKSCRDCMRPADPGREFCRGHDEIHSRSGQRHHIKLHYAQMRRRRAWSEQIDRESAAADNAERDREWEQGR
jgi:hypothetical protein